MWNFLLISVPCLALCYSKGYANFVEISNFVKFSNFHHFQIVAFRSFPMLGRIDRNFCRTESKVFFIGQH